MKQPLLVISIVIILLLVSACDSESGGFNFGGATPTPEQTPTPLPTPVKVFQATVSADGQVVLPLPPQVFSFQSSGLSGTLAEIYVMPGEYVKKGDLLARVDDTELRRALQKAEAALASTRAQIDKEEAPALAGDIAEARSSLSAAQADLVRLQDLPSEEAITQAAADLRLREVDLRRAQEAYDEVAYAQGLGMSLQAAELQQATLNYERAQAIYDEATKPATDADLAKARASIAQAQNRLDQLLFGVRPETRDIRSCRHICCLGSCRSETYSAGLGQSRTT